MPIFLEQNKKIEDKTIQIPQKTKMVFKQMEKQLEPYNTSGGAVIKRLARTPETDLGERSDKEKEDRSKLTANNAAVILTRQSKVPVNSIAYQQYGGDIGRRLLKRELNRIRSANKVGEVEPPKPTSNAQLKPKPPKAKEVTTPDGGKVTTITSEGKLIKENEDWHIMYDYLSDYNVWYVLDQFFENPKGKQNWAPLINPEMYHKALSEFTKYGKLIKFPTKYVYQWMGIIMRNTAILEVCTELAGHTQFFPGDEVSEYADSKGYEIGDSYEEGSEWLYKIGFYDWNLMPDGSDAISDYGIEPIMKIIEKYNENLPPEKVLVLVNRALDVVHCRGDLSSIFIVGGRGSLNRIAESVQKKKSKKVYINEDSLKALYDLWQEIF